MLVLWSYIRCAAHARCAVVYREARAAVITARDSAASDSSVYRAQNNRSRLETRLESRYKRAMLYAVHEAVILNI